MEAALRGWRRYAAISPLLWIGPTLVNLWIESHQSYPIEWMSRFVDVACWAGVGMFLTAALSLSYDKARLASRPRSWSIVVPLAASVIGAFLWFAGHNAFDGLIGFTGEYKPLTEMPLKELFHNTFPRSVILVLWHLLGLVTIQSRLAKAERERAYQLEKFSYEAKIRQLRGNLNPHFLFNSLNSAIALVDENAESAKEMMLSLSHILLETLTASTKKKTTLMQEMELVRKYVAIEKVRYEENLLFQEELANIPDTVVLPPFLLLPLVENAIKHGMRDSELPLRIKMQVDLSEELLTVKVTNTGVLKEQYDDGDGRDAGTGVRNMTDRLALELPGRAGFSLAQEGDLVVATLRIELEENED